MRKILGSVVALVCFAAFSPFTALAGGCGCSSDCQAKCSLGNTADCKCTHCGCKDGEKCTGGECSMKH